MKGASWRLARGLISWLLAGLAGTASQASESPDPIELLERMNEAVRVLDYEGRFVVQSGGHLDALYVVHRVTGGSEKERIVSLTGEPREVIRSDQAVACLVPGRSKPISVGRRSSGRSYSPLRGIAPQELSRLYDFRLLADDRVAGRDAFRVEIAPRDQLRFGYRVSVDRATYLPLRTTMLDTGQRKLTELMFTDLRVNEGITPIEHDLSALQVATVDPADWKPLASMDPADWEFGELPPGYRLNLHRRRVFAEPQGELEHFIFSDGLATVSVYVLPGPGDAEPPGLPGIGAAGAVARRVGGHEVIVVGEVPAQTLDWFADSIRRAR